MKLSALEIERIKSEGRLVNFNVKPTRWWSLEDLAKGKMFSSGFIKKVIRGAKLRREQHNDFGWRGWTKNRNMRSVMSIPIELFLQPEFQKRYYNEQADKQEQLKQLEALKRDYPAFRTY